MAILNLSRSFSFAAGRDWVWQATSSTDTAIVLEGGVYRQTFAGAFTYQDEFVSGVVTAVRFYANGQLVYAMDGLDANASYLQMLAGFSGDMQATYAHVLQGDDAITGSSGTDVLLGYDGNDTITGGGGNDTINGGNGTDEAVFAGNRAAAVIVYSGTGLGFTITTGQGDTVAVSNVESFRFSDQVVTAASLAVVPPTPDDFAATSATVGRLTVGASVSGSIETVGDKDWFAINLVAGQGYAFHLDGAASGGISDPLLKLFNAGGSLLATDDDSGPGLNALLYYGATQTGTYYLESSGFSGAGGYVLGAQTAVLPDTTSPTLLSFNPSDGGVNVDQAANVVLTFSEAVKRGSGLIELKNFNGLTLESFDVQSSTRVTFTGTTLTIDPTNSLPDAAYLEITFAAGTILDTAGNAWVYSGRYDFQVAAPTTGPGSGKIDLVSANAGGVMGDQGTNSGDSSAPVMSADGQIVVFNSWAGNLMTGDVNNDPDTFVKFMRSGAVAYVVTDDLNTAPSQVFQLAMVQYGSYFSMSADGRYVAFATSANNLVPKSFLADPNSPTGGTLNDSTITAGDNNTNVDVYVKDVFTGAITLASSTAAGLSLKLYGGGYDPTMSADGSRVAFTSGNDALVAGDSNFALDIFVKNLQSGAITRVSTNASGQQASTYGDSGNASFSAEGRYIVFNSTATNLVPGDTNGTWDVFRKDLQTGAIIRVSTTSAGEQTVVTPDTHGSSMKPAISASGRYVVFESDAKNLYVGDGDLSSDVYYKDLLTGNIQLVAINQAGLAAAESSYQASISDDGRYVVFNSWDENLVKLPFRHDYGPDVFIKDMQTGELRIVSAFPLDVAPYSLDGIISADGRYVALKSDYDPTGNIPGYQYYRLANPFLEVSSDSSYTLQPQEVSLRLTGTASVNGTGNGYGNVLTGNVADNLLTGGGGDDTLDGGAGLDVAGFAGNRAEYTITYDALKGQIVAADLVNGRDGVDTLINIEKLRFVNGDFSASSFLPGHVLDMQAYSWKAHTLLDGVSLNASSHSATTGASGAASFTAVTESSLTLTASRSVPTAEATATSSAVNLQDAIAILKMIVGLPVNGSNPLSPYQTLAADYDGNGTVGLNDAIGVLKHVVGLSAPDPTWHFVNEADLSIPGKTNLSPGTPQAAINADLSGAGSVHVGLVGYLSGDVDGSYAGAAGAQDLDNTQSSYFTSLVTGHAGLSLSQFGVYA